MSRLLPILSLAFVLAACSSQPPAPEQEPAKVDNANTQTSRVPQSDPSLTVDQQAVAELKSNPALRIREIFFDLDSYVIREEFKQTIDAHARYLNKYPRQKVLIQGNTDDRGSREYNLALGQKRAEAIKSALRALGAREDQVEAVSLGKEKPRCTDSSEDCWAKNRRGDLIYANEL